MIYFCCVKLLANVDIVERLQRRNSLQLVAVDIVPKLWSFPAHLQLYIGLNWWIMRLSHAVPLYLISYLEVLPKIPQDQNWTKWRFQCMYVTVEVKISVLASGKAETCFTTTSASTATAFTSSSVFLACRMTMAIVLCQGLGLPIF